MGRGGLYAFEARHGVFGSAWVASGDGLALRFICHTGLVDRFREICPRLDDEGNRAIVVGADMPIEPLRHCVTMALTCFLRKT